MNGADIIIIASGILLADFVIWILRWAFNTYASYCSERILQIKSGRRW